MPDVRKPLVLVVDDEADMRELYSIGLEDEGFRVVAAADGREAIAAMDLHVPAAVVLDMAMPHSSGLAVLNTVRERPETRHIPVIVVTGVSRDDDLWAGRDWGWDLYIQKPIELDELAESIRVLLARGQTAATPGA